MSSATCKYFVLCVVILAVFFVGCMRVWLRKCLLHVVVIRVAVGPTLRDAFMVAFEFGLNVWCISKYAF